MSKRLNRGAAAGAPCLALAHSAAQPVRVALLSGIDGEFCAQDRPLVLDDPKGTRRFHDPDRTLASGGRDPEQP